MGEQLGQEEWNGPNALARQPGRGRELQVDSKTTETPGPGIGKTSSGLVKTGKNERTFGKTERSQTTE